MEKDLNKIDFVKSISEGCSEGKHDWVVREGEQPYCLVCKAKINIDWYKMLGMKSPEFQTEIVQTETVQQGGQVDEGYIDGSELLKRLLQ